MEEARLEDVGSGLAPVSAGWFVVNVREAAWLTNDAFGARCVFEGGMPVLRRRPDLPAHRFTQLGLTLQVLQPGQPSGLYHAETNQEDFLVLAGKCLLQVEDEERPLKAWDFAHCPPGTAHAFVGAGDGPCVIFMIGARTREKDTVYPRSDLPASEVYPPYPHWQPERPANWNELPWSQARESVTECHGPASAGPWRERSSITDSRGSGRIRSASARASGPQQFPSGRSTR